ncbi:MAG: hypothetical protein ACT4NT_02310 [Nitrososphaerota archaeon]
MNDKTALFVSSIIAAIVIATPLAVIGQQGEEITIAKQVTEEEFHTAQDKVHELRGEQNKLENEALVSGETVEITQKIAELDAEIARYMPILEKHQEQKYAEYYIEPERKVQLESVELDLRKKVATFAEQNGVSAYAVNLDEKSQTIQVLFDGESLKDNLDELTKQYASDIQFEVIVGKITLVDTACAFQSDDCDPIVGGIKAVADVGQGPCTIGLPVEDG